MSNPYSHEYLVIKRTIIREFLAAEITLFRSDSDHYGRKNFDVN